MAFTDRYLIRAVRLVLLLVFPGLAVIASAGETSVSPAEVAVQFTVFAPGRIKGLRYRPSREAADVDLEFFTQTRSRLYIYRGPPVLTFYRPMAGNAESMPMAVATVPPGMTRVLLLFQPLPEPAADGRRYAVQVMDDGAGHLPPGHARVLNASGADYLGELASRPIALPHGLSEAVAASGRVQLKLAGRFQGRWVRTGTHEFVLNARSRVCLVLFPPASPTGLSPLIRTLIDELPAGEGASGSVAPGR